MTMMAWWRFGLYSEMSAMAFGMAAPRPTPVMNRIMRSCCTLPANAVIRVQMPKKIAAKMMTLLRPM